MTADTKKKLLNRGFRIFQLIEDENTIRYLTDKLNFATWNVYPSKSEARKKFNQLRKLPDVIADYIGKDDQDKLLKSGFTILRRMDLERRSAKTYIIKKCSTKTCGWLYLKKFQYEQQRNTVLNTLLLNPNNIEI